MKLVFILATILLLSSCQNEQYTPKPYGYFRIDFPKKEYRLFDSACPYKFQYPKYAEIIDDKDANTEPCWKNIEFKSMKATLHVSYKPINGNLTTLLEDTRKLVYKHTVKADAINEKLLRNDESKVFGMLYEIEGNAASPAQFFLTDSTSHFLRGSLYFNVPPNKDSLAPSIDFIKEDVRTMINTFSWK